MKGATNENVYLAVGTQYQLEGESEALWEALALPYDDTMLQSAQSQCAQAGDGGHRVWWQATDKRSPLMVLAIRLWLRNIDL